VTSENGRASPVPDGHAPELSVIPDTCWAESPAALASRQAQACARL
jgi:hypothetical protein